jgi:hypothetical protein
MANGERQSQSDEFIDRPFQPTLLPRALADFIRGYEFACVTQDTDRGTVLIVKAPGPEIESVRGRVPIALRHELYSHPAAPVIRMVLTIYDQPDRPLALETFVNVEDPQQRTEYAQLASQEEITLLFYDEQLQHRLTKQVDNDAGAPMLELVSQADALLAVIPRQHFDFDIAKAAVVKKTIL